MIPQPPTLSPAWRNTLREAGLPEAVVVIDFENYFTTEYSIRKMSAWEYVTHAEYEELGRSIKHVPAEEITGSTEWSWGDDADPIRKLQALYGKDLEGCTVVAQNLAYDGLILYLKYKIKIPNAVDILGLARHYNSQANNGLDALSKRNNLPPKGKTSDFKDQHLGEFRDPDLYGGYVANEAGEKLRDYANRDADNEWDLFCRYMPTLSNPKTEIELMRHTLGLYWEPKLTVNREEGERIRVIMAKELDDAIALAGHPRKIISSNNAFRDLILGAIEASGDNPKLYTKLGKQNKKTGNYPILLASAQTDDQREKMVGHFDPTVRNLINARIAIKSWPNHIKRIESIKSMSAAAGGLMPVPLKYHGAHTGRWSGYDGVNLQNLGSRGAEVVIRIRGMLEAPEGYKLVVVDAAAIEPRVLAWLADQFDLVERFEQNADVYSEFAESLLNRPVQKPREDDPKPVADWRKWARNGVGKVGILGLGYGMGAKKAVGYAAGAIDLEMAKKMVQLYRSKNSRIVRYWGELERKFKAAAKYGEPSSLSQGVRIYKEGSDVLMRLPSGRVLRYENIHVVTDGRNTSLVIPAPDGRGTRTHTWGGTLAENITQAVSRDLLAEAILATENVGYRVVLHCHDEIVACVPDQIAEQALKDIIGILSLRPEWAAGCPLDAEGSIMERYGKCK